jgi:hypothetical protein
MEKRKTRLEVFARAIWYESREVKSVTRPSNADMLGSSYTPSRRTYHCISSPSSAEDSSRVFSRVSDRFLIPELSSRQWDLQVVRHCCFRWLQGRRDVACWAVVSWVVFSIQVVISWVVYERVRRCWPQVAPGGQDWFQSQRLPSCPIVAN